MLFYCLQVDLKFPKVISDGARDLISKLLRHSPTDRLSLKSVIDHPWVSSNSRRVLPPVPPAKKCWAPPDLPANLPLRSVFICPSQKTLGQHVSVSLPWASNCCYSGTFYDGRKWMRTFFLLYSVTSLYMFSMLSRGVLCFFYCHSFPETALLDFCIWRCWHQSITVSLPQAEYILHSFRWGVWVVVESILFLLLSTDCEMASVHLKNYLSIKVVATFQIWAMRKDCNLMTLECDIRHTYSLLDALNLNGK